MQALLQNTVDHTVEGTGMKTSLVTFLCCKFLSKFLRSEPHFMNKIGRSTTVKRLRLAKSSTSGG